MGCGSRSDAPARPPDPDGPPQAPLHPAPTPSQAPVGLEMCWIALPSPSASASLSNQGRRAKSWREGARLGHTTEEGGRGGGRGNGSPCAFPPQRGRAMAPRGPHPGPRGPRGACPPPPAPRPPDLQSGPPPAAAAAATAGPSRSCRRRDLSGGRPPTASPQSPRVGRAPPPICPFRGCPRFWSRMELLSHLRPYGQPSFSGVEGWSPSERFAALPHSEGNGSRGY